LISCRISSRWDDVRLNIENIFFNITELLKVIVGK